MNKDVIRILLVEDNPNDKRLIQEILKQYDYLNFEIIDVHSLENALLKIGENPNLDLILCDLTLHDNCGPEIVQILYNNVKNIPIIVISGNNTDETIIQAIQFGAYSYISKDTLNGNLKTAILSARVRKEMIQKANEKVIKTIKETFKL